ncbi:hypothetical protein [Methylibium petroleiphilum]|uniref:Uncharacterized protein n=1 Tax=Methylibium petroleiphilum (strain ATCC BAA-1232 / LMG 22953 / PM1) TaxID=420662 RepID=A2SNC8_METPP|nr:hypothetical protein [Methylibium petroleiphilum]ABM97067.1 hypothetical protein Mpe_B0292 [Methylibium petroleiphilum PM1]
MKKSIVQRIATLKPRNVFAPLAGRRAAGAHASRKRHADVQRKDLVQRLREAGM